MTAVRRTLHDRSAAQSNEPWRLLHHYWLSKHVDGQLPTHDDIDPITEVPRLVANMMIIDATEEGFVYRFVGTEVVAHTDQDLTGQHVGLSRKYAGIQTQWVQALNSVWRTQHPRLLLYHFDMQVEAKHLVLLLPLRAAPGGVDKILGGSFFDGYFPPGLHADGVTVQEVPV
jgi:hypothetical protein